MGIILLRVTVTMALGATVNVLSLSGLASALRFWVADRGSLFLIVFRRKNSSRRIKRAPGGFIEVPFIRRGPGDSLLGATMVPDARSSQNRARTLPVNFRSSVFVNLTCIGTLVVEDLGVRVNT